MAHYKSNWSDPSHCCHQHCLVPLSLLTLFSWSKHFTSIADIICTLRMHFWHQLLVCMSKTWSLHPEEEYSSMIFVTKLSGIKGDGRGLTSGTISGGSYGVSATRQLATTKLLRHNNISEPGKLNSLQSVRERALFVFPWLKWAVWVVTRPGRGAAVSQPTFHLFCQQQELTTTSNWSTKTFQSFSHNACPVQSPISFPFFSFWKLSQRL